MLDRSLVLILCLTFFSCGVNPGDTSQKKVNTDEAGAQIHSLLDEWHQAAATADEEKFFGTMSEEAIYLGTDKTERWKRDELREWSKKAFEREKAWAFTPYNRQLYFSEDGRTAWFEELLETWMGPCRGSGVLIYRDSIWKLEHYNLAMLIDNEDVQAVLSIIQQPDEQPGSQPDSQ